LCFASKACIYNVTANWQQKPSKFCVTLFDDKLAAKIEQILYSTTPILRDNMQGLLGFRSQFVVRQRYARFARFLLTICHQVTWIYLPVFCHGFAIKICQQILLRICKHFVDMVWCIKICIKFVSFFANKICSKILQDLFLTDLAGMLLFYKLTYVIYIYNIYFVTNRDNKTYFLY